MADSGIAGSLERFWYVTAPRWLQRPAPRASEAAADGVWTAAWPWVGAAAPVAGFLIGMLFARGLPAGAPYTVSLPFVAMMAMLAVLHGTAALAAMAGFTAVDLLTAWHVSFRGAFRELPWIMQAVRLYGSLLVGYLLLSMLIVRAPVAVRRVVNGLPTARVVTPHAAPAVRAVLSGLAYAVLVWIWCQAMIVLVRPAFTWLLDNPTVQAVRTVQASWPLLALLAAAAAAGRALLEDRAARRAPRAAAVRALRAEREAETAPTVTTRPVVRVAIQAVMTTLLLAGAYSAPLDAVIVLLATALLAAWDQGLAGAPAAMWGRLVLRVPAIVRLGAAMALGYWLAGIVVARLWYGWASGTFRPVLFGGLAAMAVFYLLFPQSLPPAREAAGREPA